MSQITKPTVSEQTMKEITAFFMKHAVPKLLEERKGTENDRNTNK